MAAGGYFLPFTPNGKAIEIVAIEVKQRLGLAAEDSVDPYAILERVPARLVDMKELGGAASSVVEQLLGPGRNEWSAICFGASPVTGIFDILVNPTHHQHRRRVSLMEEIVHVIRRHPPTILSVGAATNASSRSYDTTVEDEAYCVGAACILPYPALFSAVHRNHETISAIAAAANVSEEYVTYRIKRAGLSRIYARQHPRGRESTRDYRVR